MTAVFDEVENFQYPRSSDRLFNVLQRADATVGLRLSVSSEFGSSIQLPSVMLVGPIGSAFSILGVRIVYSTTAGDLGGFLSRFFQYPRSSDRLFNAADAVHGVEKRDFQYPRSSDRLFNYARLLSDRDRSR